MYLPTPSLLITDDDRALRETLRDVFQERGFRTLLAEDGEEALQIMRSERIHVAVFDFQMPRMNGLEAVRELHKSHCAVPWILMSAGVNAAMVDEARQLEVFSVLQKPVRCAELTGVVQQALRSAYGWQ